MSRVQESEEEASNDRNNNDDGAQVVGCDGMDAMQLVSGKNRSSRN